MLPSKAFLNFGSQFSAMQRPNGCDSVSDQRERTPHVVANPHRWRRKWLAFPSPVLELFIAEVTKREKEGFAHVGSECLICVEVCHVRTGVHGPVIGEFVDVFTILWVRGI